MKVSILKHKTHILALVALLIISAFANHFIFQQPLLAQILLILASILGAAPIIIQAYESLKIKVISIDILVSIAIIGALFIRNYEESAIVSFLFLLGAFLEQRTLGKTRSAIKELLELAPSQATLIHDNGYLETIPSDDVQKGQRLLVKTGDKIPVDGLVLTGTAYVNEASITGESKLLKKETGATVFAGSLLDNGTIELQAEKVGEDTVFGKIIELVEEAQDSKSQTEQFINTFSKYYTPLVLIIALFTFIITGNSELAITILVLGCPGALVIGVPVSTVAGIGNGAKQGILFKGSDIITTFSKADTILFDKTGTLTQGKPQLTRIETLGTVTADDWSYLVSLERESQHPLAQAIVDGLEVDAYVPVTDSQTIKGGGISAQIAGHDIIVGNEWLIRQHLPLLSLEASNTISDITQTGHSLVLVAIDGHLKMALGIKDALRPEVPKVIQQLKKQGFTTIAMLSGDNQETAYLIAQEAGIEQAYGNLLPEDKEGYIRRLQDQGHRVIFVGDGVNDSPSLTRADLGIAIGGGTDVAMETADIVLMQANLSRLPLARQLSIAITRNMRQNITIAILVVATLITGLIASDWVSMTVGMFIHEASILVVILNGMRLLSFGKSSKVDTYQGKIPKEVLS
ncbi:lead, cadmium, zinc and mercury transporting ATPase [Streptococcus acidominimus]|uniref:Cd(2+)-exporting ATPase n=1 Tax=Streptococcus acidominimus TaxID=1326 RepID=A0A239WWY1_STRAI|nr:heavy metal translocating P-type ATPase [Streptococcus acidominimus]SNV38922.1 lead, cadmium, zinc and mercury transporting ATPase [Streptococcus acidominimus]